jgi:hypothetical protein
MMVWKSAAHLAGFHPQKFSNLAIHCGHKTLQLLNERLGTGGQFDDTIACTILMLTAQAVSSLEIRQLKRLNEIRSTLSREHYASSPEL